MLKSKVFEVNAGLLSIGTNPVETVSTRATAWMNELEDQIHVRHIAIGYHERVSSVVVWYEDALSSEAAG